MSTDPLRADGAAHPAYLVVGEDAALVSQELSALLAVLGELEGIGAAAIEEYGEPGQDEPIQLGPVLAACRTPPFFSDKRVVVVRDAARLDAAQQREVVEYLAEPLASTVLVLATTGRSPAALTRAIGAAGTVLRAEPATGRARQQWIAEHVARSSLRLDARATTLLGGHIGEDLARLEGILGALAAAYGPGAAIHEAELEPFLGEAGGIAPWDLTDALDGGDLSRSLEALHRMLEGGERHPLQVIAVLHRHYGAMLRLDGADVTDEAGASVATGLAPYPAKKALAQARRLGHERIAAAVSLLGAADLDLRGRIGWPGELVLEVLVARLAQLVRLRPSPPRRQAARR